LRIRQEKLREIVLYVRRDPIGAQDLKNPLRIGKKDKISGGVVL
jgi:hypothetical protein